MYRNKLFRSYKLRILGDLYQQVTRTIFVIITVLLLFYHRHHRSHTSAVCNNVHCHRYSTLKNGPYDLWPGTECIIMYACSNSELAYCNLCCHSGIGLYSYRRRCITDNNYERLTDVYYYTVCIRVNCYTAVSACILIFLHFSMN